jgi:hypothetical protein
MTTEPVLFYGHVNGLYSAFSNFYPAEFVLDGHRFACSEQAFMYGKSEDDDYRRLVLRTRDPYAVKRLGRAAKLRKDWDNVKYGWMVTVLKAKFSQNPRLRDLLLVTGNRAIHENCKDPWWGGGPNFPGGRDLLGKALMEVRAWLREQGETEDACSGG